MLRLLVVVLTLGLIALVIRELLPDIQRYYRMMTM
jgi:uncharacterized protein DUF6893